MERRRRREGFTLIEMSIVLVIIGLIVGGILAGRDLVASAAIRAQVTQVEKYNTAVNTFRSKYGYLPGDLKATEAASFGFLTREGRPGQGDGNGVIEGVNGNPGANSGFFSLSGETAVFWRDLTVAQLIEDKFSTAGTAVLGVVSASGAGVDAYLPHAKMENGNYISVYSNGGVNYYMLSLVPVLGNASTFSQYGLTVRQAYAIDQKMDDGYPQTGGVIAARSYGGGLEWSDYWVTGTAATAGSATTCYDNANVGGATQQYSIKQSGGRNVNCAISFQFQ